MVLGMLKRGDILNADDLDIKVVEVPEWNGCVKVRELTAQERGDVESSILTLDGSGNLSLREGANVREVMCRVVRWATLNDDDTPMFPDANDEQQLKRRNPNAIQRIYDAAMELSGIGGKTEDKARDPGEAPGDESSSGPAESSPPISSP